MTTRGFLLTGNKPVLILTFLISLFFCNGCHCTTSVHVYDGTPLPKEQVAKVITEFRKQTTGEFLLSISPSSIFIETVDGKDPEKCGTGCVIPIQIFVLPGPHDFDIRFSGPRTTQAGGFANVIAQTAYDMKYSRFRTLLTFTTQANHEYVIRFLEHAEPWKDIDSVKYWVEDVHSGEVIMGEKPAETVPFKPRKEQMEETK